MYLSRVEIDIQNRQKIRELSHLGAYHNWVETCFPDEFKHGERSRKLWRIDHLSNRQYLLLVSSQKPDLTCLERYGVPGTASSKNYDNYIRTLRNGMYVRFRATLNPVQSIPSPISTGCVRERGRVVPHVTVAQQMKFFQDRADSNGFQIELDDFRIVERSHLPLKRKGNKTIRMSIVSYEGKLKINDVTRFRKALCEGIGRGKSYGCGMLTVIPEG